MALRLNTSEKSAQAGLRRAAHQAAIQHSGKRRATSLPTGNRAPSGAVIFSRISVFVAKKHSRSILRKMLLECFFATKTLMREKITAPEGARFPVGRLVARLLPECCIAAWCAARRNPACALFSLVFKRRATREKAPSSAHRESAKSALFL